MDWISVKDKLPEKRGLYIVAYNPCLWENVSSEKRVGTDSYRGGGSWAKNKYQKVTHWMPLPDSPEGE